MYFIIVPARLKTKVYQLDWASMMRFPVELYIYIYNSYYVIGGLPLDSAFNPMIAAATRKIRG